MTPGFFVPISNVWHTDGLVAETPGLPLLANAGGGLKNRGGGFERLPVHSYRSGEIKLRTAALEMRTCTNNDDSFDFW